MAKRIIIAEAHADAPKPLCGVPDGSGYRDMARSESSAQELGRPADGILEGRMGLTVNREKTKVLDSREPHTTLTFLGNDFRMVRDRLFGMGKRYLTFGPSKAFHAVNGYALRRMARHLNHRSQRRYRLKFADTYYGELNHYGMYWLKWADVRR